MYWFVSMNLYDFTLKLNLSPSNTSMEWSFCSFLIFSDTKLMLIKVKIVSESRSNFSFRDSFYFFFFFLWNHKSGFLDDLRVLKLHLCVNINCCSS
ncbi:hypothetical protein PUN28_006956 [Cardiocondyla obscurior]|uniref:Uncharacterized protein n=1 Tax=Cardiocondyla obscurior TaxID=286306 RepID=A0AAW2G491_9HYME